MKVYNGELIAAPYELPDGWKWVQQGEVCKLTDGEKRTGEQYPYLEVRYLRGTKARDVVSEGKFIKSGTKVILVDGENSGEVFTVSEDGYMGSTFKALSIQNVDENYLGFFIAAKKDLYKNNKKGSAIPHLDKKLFSSMPFPLPPLNCQLSIINSIETFFSHIDKIAAQAQAAADLYEPFRAKLLQMAFNGELKIDNGEWRSDNGRLRIDNWEETTLGKIVSGFKYGVSDKCDYEGKGIPVLRIPNIGDGFLDFCDLKYSERKTVEGNYIVRKGDVLIIRSNGSRDLVGKAAVFDSEGQFSYGSFLIKITPSEKINARYLVYFLNSPVARKQMFSKTKSSAGINNINSKELSIINLKLPPLHYQLSIVNYLDTVLEKARAVHNEATELLAQIPKLKKAVLAKAFGGKLVIDN